VYPAPRHFIPKEALGTIPLHDFLYGQIFLGLRRNSQHPGEVPCFILCLGLVLIATTRFRV